MLKNIKYFILSIFPAILAISPALAIEQIGVVRSIHNQKQWSGITQRLQFGGINYCYLDSKTWNGDKDLQELKVLFLPNVADLTLQQAESLERWMKRGGKLIVTGDSGNEAKPAVRSKLRWLFGGYLQPQTKVKKSPPSPEAGLPFVSGIQKQGVLTPVGENTQTAAVWEKDGKAAILTTNNSTFLGWNWGNGAYSPTEIDQKWLQAALERYGFNLDNNITPTPPTACVENKLASKPINPDEEKQDKPTQQQQRETLLEFASMNQQLDSFIERFESTLAAADSLNSDGELLPLVKSLQVNSSIQNKQLQDKSFGNITTNKPAHEALRAAKEKQQNFVNLYTQGNYEEAKREWKEAQNLLLNNYPTDRKVAEPEVRAIWLDRGTIVKAKSEADLAILFDNLSKAGINTVFFETLNASYPIYPSQIAPQQNPLVEGWDPLASAVKLAHERGMELHAWVWVFAAANQRHNLIMNKPLDYLGPVLSQRPDWGMTDKNGNLFDFSSKYKKAFLDPANPEVRQYLLSIINEIITRYKVDGIQLDYIRYPFQDPKAEQTFGYSKTSREMFIQQTGIDPITLTPKDALWQAWVNFKIQQVDTFVSQASQLIKHSKPEIILSVAVFPLPTQERLNRIQQNWETWASNHWVDIIALMTYTIDSTNIATVMEPLFDERLGSTLLLPGIRLLDMPDTVAIDRTQLLRHLPAFGYSLFAMENFNPSLQQIFNRTQGSTQLNQQEPIPHRQPFQAAAARYEILQREWSFLVSNNGITMDPQAMREWAKQADFVKTILNQLAKQPSSKNLLTAQIALSSLQRQIPVWMRTQQQNRPYQVQAWINRLATVDRLLNYGDRLFNLNYQTSSFK